MKMEEEIMNLKVNALKATQEYKKYFQSNTDKSISNLLTQISLEK